MYVLYDSWSLGNSHYYGPAWPLPVSHRLPQVHQNPTVEKVVYRKRLFTVVATSKFKTCHIQKVKLTASLRRLVRKAAAASRRAGASRHP